MENSIVKSNRSDEAAEQKKDNTSGAILLETVSPQNAISGGHDADNAGQQLVQDSNDDHEDEVPMNFPQKVSQLVNPCCSPSFSSFACCVHLIQI